MLVSSLTDAIILVELTVPWEDRLQYSNALKVDKYADLSMDLEVKGYLTDLFPIEVGTRGIVGRSTFLAKIGLSSRERTKAMTRMSETAEAASFWIWHVKSQKSSEATSGKSEKAVELRYKWSTERQGQIIGWETRYCRVKWVDSGLSKHNGLRTKRKGPRSSPENFYLRLSLQRNYKAQFAYIKYTVWRSHWELSWPLQATVVDAIDIKRPKRALHSRSLQVQNR